MPEKTQPKPEPKPDPKPDPKPEPKPVIDPPGKFTKADSDRFKEKSNKPN